MEVIKRLRDLLPAELYGQTNLLVFMVVISVWLECLGISLLLPMFELMLGGGSDKSSVIQLVGKLIPIGTGSEALLKFLGIITAVYAIKLAFLILFNYVQADYTSKIQSLLSARLFDGYMNQPWSFFLTKKSSDMMRAATSDIFIFAFSFIAPILIIVSEGTIILGLGAFMFFIEPVGFLVVLALLLIVSFLFFKSTNNISNKLGERRQRSDGQRIETLQNGIRGIRTILAFNKISFFTNRYAANNSEMASALKGQSFLEGMPRVIFEMVAILAIVLLISSLILMKQDMSTILIKVGVFTAITFRILPSVGKLSQSFQSLQYAEPVVANLQREFDEMRRKVESNRAPKKINFEKSLNFENVCFKYENATTHVFENFSFKFKRNDIIGVIGKPGAGKTTLVELLLGFWKPESGTITVDGETDIYENSHEWRKDIGYVPQDTFIFNGTIAENIALGLEISQIDFEQINYVLKQACLFEHVQKLEFGANSIVGDSGSKLSGGQIQRIGIARALYKNPKILILDEATSSLDKETQSSFYSVVSSLKDYLTIIIVTHDLSEIDFYSHHYDLLNQKLILKDKK